MLGVLHDRHVSERVRGDRVSDAREAMAADEGARAREGETRAGEFTARGGGAAVEVREGNLRRRRGGRGRAVVLALGGVRRRRGGGVEFVSKL